MTKNIENWIYVYQRQNLEVLIKFILVHYIENYVQIYIIIMLLFCYQTDSLNKIYSKLARYYQYLLNNTMPDKFKKFNLHNYKK